MKNEVSIAEARNHLTRLVRRVERGRAVTLTRRGQPVAVLVSLAELNHARQPRMSLWEAIQKFRREHDMEALNFGPKDLEGLRDRSPGRDFRW